MIETFVLNVFVKLFQACDVLSADRTYICKLVETDKHNEARAKFSFFFKSSFLLHRLIV